MKSNVFVFFLFVTEGSVLSVPEFDLNLEKRENNVNGFFAFVSPSFVFDDEQIEVVVLQKQVNDIEDVRNPSNSIVVSLLPDGSVVVVEEPSVPTFMTFKGHELYNGCASEEMANALRTTHGVCMTSIQTQNRQKTKYVLNFPDKIICQMGYMNPATGRTLRGHVAVSKSEYSGGKTSGIAFTHVTIRYMAVIKSEERKLLRSAEATSNIEDLLAGMFLNENDME